MSRFRKLSHTIWHCQYHLVWTPKYRYRILEGDVAREVERCIRAFGEQNRCEIVELNVQCDHVSLAFDDSPQDCRLSDGWDLERPDSYSGF